MNVKDDLRDSKKLCFNYIFKIRAMQKYTVLIGVNGAGLMNGLYLPPHGVAVQLVPYNSSVSIFTARVRSTTGRYCCHRHQSVHRGVPHPSQGGYPPPGQGRYPPRTCYMVGGMPHVFTQEDFLVTARICSTMGDHGFTGVCLLTLEGGGEPHPSQGGYHHGQGSQGRYSPGPRQVPPPPSGMGDVWTGYAAGGTPLAVSRRRTFLFVMLLGEGSGIK